MDFHDSLRIFIDFYGFSYFFRDLHESQSIFLHFNGFSLLLWVSGNKVREPVATLRLGLCSYIFRFEIADSNPAGLEAWMPRCWQDCSGLEWVAARWEEFLEEIPTSSTLHEVGGFLMFDDLFLAPCNTCFASYIETVRFVIHLCPVWCMVCPYVCL